MHKISEMNVVWGPVILGPGHPIKGAKKKTMKAGQDVENLNRMVNEMQ